MKKQSFHFTFTNSHFKFAVALASLAMFVAVPLRAAEDVIEINKNAKRILPISVTGFSGEADSVLKFDLTVMGMEIVAPSAAEYQVSGSNNGRVEGRLVNAGKTLLAQAYTGGTTRSQAHALAEDIVKITRETKPIFHTKIAFRLEKEGTTEICVADWDGHNPVVVTHDGTL